MTPNPRLVRWLELVLGGFFAVMTALLLLGSVFDYQGNLILALAAGLLTTGFWVPSARWPRAWILPRKLTRGGAIAVGVFFLSIPS
jgi:hypothetical protein